MATLIREVLPTKAVLLPPGATARLFSTPDGDGDGNVVDQASIFVDVHALDPGVQGQVWLRGGARLANQVRLQGAPSATLSAAGLVRATWPQPLPPYFSAEIVLVNTSASVATAILRALGCARQDGP